MENGVSLTLEELRAWLADRPHKPGANQLHGLPDAALLAQWREAHNRLEEILAYWCPPAGQTRANPAQPASYPVVDGDGAPVEFDSKPYPPAYAAAAGDLLLQAALFRRGEAAEARLKPAEVMALQRAGWTLRQSETIGKC